MPRKFPGLNIVDYGAGAWEERPETAAGNGPRSKLAMRRSPRLHQLNALRWARNRRTAALFMDMRLGKSWVAMRWLATRPKAQHRLVLSPKSAHADLVSEAGHAGLHAEVIAGPVDGRLDRAIAAFDTGADVVIATYQSLVSGGKASSFARHSWCAVALDECTAIKSPSAIITKVALRHLRPPFRLLMSGLPDPEAASEFVTQLLWLRGEVMGCRDYWEWRAKFMRPTPWGAWELKPGSRKLLMADVASCAFILTRKQAGWLGGKLRRMIFVKLPPAAEDAVRLCEQQLEHPITGELTCFPMVAASWAAQVCGGAMPGLEHSAKTSAVVDCALNRGQVPIGTPLVVWARFNAEVRNVATALRVAGFKVAAITGRVLQSERAASCAAFQRGELDVIVANPAALKMGVNLSRAVGCVYLSTPWSYETRTQSEDRIVCMGDARAKVIADVVATSTADEDAAMVVAAKGVDAKAYQRTFLSRLPTGPTAGAGGAK